MSENVQLATGRSSEEIDAILCAAKLDRKELLPVSQEISFSECFSGTEYRLVELPKEVAEKISVGNRIVFRGEGNDHAVLCTDNITFEIKEAETSNSLLIFEELSFPEQAQKRGNSSDSSSSSKSPDSVCNLPIIPLNVDKAMEDDEDVELEEEILARPIRAIAHSYFELKKITPNLSKIRNVMAANPYKGVGEEESNPEELNFHTMDSLLEVIPASEGEIEDYLKTIRHINSDGFLRLIDDEYLFRVFTHVAQLVEENSWKPERIPKSVVITTLINLEPLFVIEKIFDWFFFQKNEDNEDIFCMKEDEICKFIGEALLKPSGRFNLSEFMKVWQQSVPEGLKVNLEQLEGLAVTNTQVSPSVIWHFPEYNLPDLATDRFAVLFEGKQKWKLEEITPFLRNLPSCQSIGILLTKFARVNTLNGVKYYSSKHSK